MTMTATKPKRATQVEFNAIVDNVLAKKNGAQASTPGASIAGEMVPLADIVRDGRNHRLKTSMTPEVVKRRAESMGKEGQLQSVRVYDAGKDGLILGYGFVRCAAAELLGWTHIRADRLPAPRLPSGEVDYRAIHRARFVENVSRDQLNPMEKARGLAEIVQEYGGDVDTAARELLIDARTIRDHLYLTRLSPKVQEWVMDGSLRLKFAREIAKLGDHDDQEDLAQDCRVGEAAHAEDADDEKGGTDSKFWNTKLLSFNQLREQVAQRMRALDRVPWQLEAHFPLDKKSPIVGPCTGCPFNSATDRNLFEADDKAPETGKCMKADCFEAKEKVVKVTVEKLSKKVVSEKRAATEKQAQLVVDTNDAAFVKPGPVARAAKKIIDAKKPPSERPAAKKQTAAAAKKSPEDQRREAERRYGEAHREWIGTSERKVTDAAKKTTGGLTQLIIAGHHDVLESMWNLQPKKLQAAMADVRQMLVAPIPLQIAAFEKHYGRHVLNCLDMFSSTDCGPLLQLFAEHFKVKLDPEPQKSDFLPAKPAAAAKQAGKGKKQPKNAIHDDAVVDDTEDDDSDDE